MNPTRMDRLNFVSSLVLTLFGAGVTIESARMPRLENLSVNPYTVPGIVPGVLGVLLTLCGLAVLVRSVARGGWRLGLTREGVALWLRSTAARRTGLTLALTLTFALVLFPFVPFYLATPIFIFSFIVSAEAMALGHWPQRRTILSAAALAIIAGFVIGYVFQDLFLVRLPAG
jgi:hypothetical protein